MNCPQYPLTTLAASLALMAAPFAANADAFLDGAHAGYAYDSLDRNVRSALPAHCVRTGAWTPDATDEACVPLARRVPPGRARAPTSGGALSTAPGVDGRNADKPGVSSAGSAPSGALASAGAQGASEHADARGAGGGGVHGAAALAAAPVYDRSAGRAVEQTANTSAAGGTGSGASAPTAPSAASAAAGPSAAGAASSDADARASANPSGREQQHEARMSSSMDPGKGDAARQAPDRSVRDADGAAVSGDNAGNANGGSATAGTAPAAGAVAAALASRSTALPPSGSAEAERTDDAPVMLPLTISVEASPLFDFDRAAVRSDSQDTLDRLLIRLKDVHYGKIVAVGYADPIGTELYNLELSRKRAESVRRYLESKGVPGASIQSEGRGATQEYAGMGRCAGLGRAPLLECLQPDRRVEVTILPADH
jgi:OOP family OmpA-OmpF porin